MRESTAVEPLNKAMPRVVRMLLAQAPMSDGKFEFAWRIAVGPSLERVTRATLGEDGTVEVQVDDAAWRKEVKRSHGFIQSKLQELLGPAVVKKLKIVGGGR